MDRTDKQRRSLDPVGTRTSILEAALKCFAEVGYDGASIGQIAKAAGVPKSLVQYHFENKDNLFQQCVASKAGPALEALDHFLTSEDHDPRALIEARFRIFRSNPEVGRLLAWASLGRSPIPAVFADRRPLFGNLFQKSESRAKFQRLMLAISAMDGWFVHRRLYRFVIGDTGSEEAAEDRFLNALLDLVGGDDEA